MLNLDGYGLWLECQALPADQAAAWRPQFENTHFYGSSAILNTAYAELQRCLKGLLNIEEVKRLERNSEVAGQGEAGRPTAIFGLRKELAVSYPLLIPNGPIIKDDGYQIIQGSKGEQALIVLADSERGLLYAVFAVKRLLESGKKPVSGSNVLDEPKIQYRMLDHWDNLDGSIERGYAGQSLWNWDELPAKLDSRYTDYARALASVGLNASVLNNVNTQPEILTAAYLEKVAAIAGILRRWGIKTFLSVNFGSPRFLGGLKSSDPLDAGVIKWWTDKVAEIYRLIPDFGGFLVKADSEGQPGPFAYGRSHADGANMLAKAFERFGGIVIWRAFVYGHGESDRAKKAYANFTAHDGEFLPNAVIQVKNGPIDFMPREPVSPLFGAMDKTGVFMEFQVAQEYLGQGNHIVYLAPMWKEILSFDMRTQGPGSQVGRIISKEGAAGRSGSGKISGIAAVSNTGSDRNWSGSHFHQANWYAYGRLAWDWTLDDGDIAREWIRGTWSREASLVDKIWSFMNGSWEACINYMSPLGLLHIMKEGHHYGPDPAFDGGPREDWRSTYYHRADKEGLGFDRSRRGSGYVDQYVKEIADIFDNIKTCPEGYLVFFHHVPWNYVLASGRSLRDELVFLYGQGVKAVQAMRTAWLALEKDLQPEPWKAVLNKLDIQLSDAKEWEAVCVPYFLQFADTKEA